MNTISIKELLKPPGKVENARLEMWDSLMVAIEDAGGNTHVFQEEILEGMTVIELIDKLAQNNIRFTYTRSAKEN